MIPLPALRAWSVATLVEICGVGHPQAKEFFMRSTTIRLNVTVGTQFADRPCQKFKLRIVGD